MPGPLHGWLSFGIRIADLEPPDLRQPIGGGAFPQSVFSKRAAEHHIFIKTAGMTRAWEELMRPSRIRELIKTQRYAAARVNNATLI